MKEFYFLSGIIAGAVIGMVCATRCQVVQDCVEITEKKAKEACEDIKEAAVKAVKVENSKPNTGARKASVKVKNVSSN